MFFTHLCFCQSITPEFPLDSIIISKKINKIKVKLNTKNKTYVQKKEFDTFGKLLFEWKKNPENDKEKWTQITYDSKNKINIREEGIYQNQKKVVEKKYITKLLNFDLPIYKTVILKNDTIQKQIYIYDSLNNPLSISYISQFDTIVEYFIYDEYYALAKVNKRNSKKELLSTTNYSYVPSLKMKEISHEFPENPISNYKELFVYNSNKKLLEEYLIASDPLTGTLKMDYLYDSLDRKVKIIGENKTNTQIFKFEYIYEYNSQDLLIKETKKENNKIVYELTYEYEFWK